jgi:N-6 DNA Methylase/TaqI-like C-terminal specificity domain
MPLFQKSVQKKYISQLEKATLDLAYQKLMSHFGDATIQNNIKNAKEEEYQEGFVRDLFVNILGYTLKPQPNFNFVLEKKNEKDSKKADGAILRNDKVIAVIELKSLKTLDLQSVQHQAFSYKNNQSNCTYIITSNFQKLRFYIDNAVDFEEFDLFDLSRERFALLYLCLNAESILSDLPILIKKASLAEEEIITKKLYKDYSDFKNALLKDITAHYKGTADKLTIFKKTQKLLDRFLFIFFAEDKELLSPNFIDKILAEWEFLKTIPGAYQSLYERFKLYFGYLNSGYQGNGEDIFAYNGGLFSPDAFLDNLTITDNVLYNNTILLSHYDFDTEVDTNILGHIFEHSLNEIEEMTALSEGNAPEKGKTKRKKDGIFYTPRYITKYIVENTIGALCRKKKQELELDTENYAQDHVKTYREWLLQLTILDPACGSGAFLSEALDFLIQEHALINSMSLSPEGETLVFVDNVTDILENNIFGVDINEESVEIAKLSLWLRTAKIGRKLNDLSHNIKCGNSLINAVKVVAPDNLVWQTAFPQVFVNGGFDIIIGNPPYIKEPVNKAAFDGLREHPYYQGKMDLWTFFGCVAIDLVKENGLIGFIVPNNWVSNAGASIFRNKMLTDGMIKTYIDFGAYNVFEDAGIQTMMYVFEKTPHAPQQYLFDIKRLTARKPNAQQVSNWVIGADEKVGIGFATLIDSATMIDQFLSFNENEIATLTEKLRQKAHFYLEKDDIAQGIVPNPDILNKNGLSIIGEKNAQARQVTEGDGIFVLPKAFLKHLSEEETERLKPLYEPADYVRFYMPPNFDREIIYLTKKHDIAQYPNLKNHLFKFREIMDNRRENLNNRLEYYHLHWGRDERFFEKGAKIVSARKCAVPTFAYTELDTYVMMSSNVIKTDKYDLKVLTVLLNSKLIAYWLRYRGKMQGDLYQIDKEPLLSIPLRYPVETAPYIAKCDEMCALSAKFQKTNYSFLKFLQSEFPNLAINKKIENWYALTFTEFRKELEKQKIKASSQKIKQFMEFFDEESESINEIRKKINFLEIAINKLIYNLYELSNEEIKIIEK